MSVIAQQPLHEMPKQHAADRIRRARAVHLRGAPAEISALILLCSKSMAALELVIYEGEIGEIGKHEHEGEYRAYCAQGEQ